MEWKTAFEAGNVVVAVFLDLKRAFETVCRGIRGKEKDWFISYLNKRFQATNYNGVSSENRPTQFGVPLGAKLASLLLLIYINDINECLKYCKIKLFAVDTLMHIGCKDPKVAVQQMNEDLQQIQRWLNMNKLKKKPNV